MLRSGELSKRPIVYLARHTAWPKLPITRNDLEGCGLFLEELGERGRLKKVTVPLPEQSLVESAIGCLSSSVDPGEQRGAGWSSISPQLSS